MGICLLQCLQLRRHNDEHTAASQVIVGGFAVVTLHRGL